MTYNAGIEYINLKDAKYNRDKRMMKTGVKSPVSVSANTVRTAPVRSSQNTAVSGSKNNASRNTASSVIPVKRNVPAYAKTMSKPYSYSRAHASVRVNPVDEEYTAKDVIGDIADAIGRAAAKKLKEAERERSRRPRYIVRKAENIKPLPISVIGYMLVFAAIAAFLVLGNSRINEATLKADALKSEIALETERSYELSSAINQRKDMAYIEDYAENVLGMVKSTDVAKRYVSISGEDKIVVRNAAIEPSNQTAEQTVSEN